MLLINVMYIIHVLLCAHGCSVSDAVSWRRFVKRATQHVWRAGAEPTLPIAKRTTPCSYLISWTSYAKVSARTAMVA